MEATNQDPVGTSDRESSGRQEETSNDKVDYKSYEKLLKEKKSVQQREREREQELQEMRERIEAFEREKLEKKGEYEQLLSKYKEENQQLKSTAEERHRAFVMSKVNSAIEKEAAKQGCINVGDFRRLLDSTDIEALSVDDSYEVDPKEVEELVSQHKSKRDYLFKKRSANVQTADPVGAPVGRTKPIDKMSDDEIRELYKKLSKQMQ